MQDRQPYQSCFFCFRRHPAAPVLMCSQHQRHQLPQAKHARALERDRDVRSHQWRASRLAPGNVGALPVQTFVWAWNPAPRLRFVYPGAKHGQYGRQCARVTPQRAVSLVGVASRVADTKLGGVGHASFPPFESARCSVLCNADVCLMMMDGCASNH